MIRKVYTIYDLKALVYGPTMVFETNPAAVRFFTDLANDKQGQVGKHPDDYVLFEIGKYDDQSAELVATIPPVKLGLASDYIEAFKN